MADVVAVMRSGRIVELGSPEDIYRRPRELSTARFVGELTELPGFADPVTDSVRTAVGRLPAVLAPSLRSGEPVQVCLRPEQLVVSAATCGVGLTGVVTQSWYHGPVTAVAVDVAGDGLVVPVRARCDRRWPVGSRVRVHIAGTALAYPLDAAESTAPHRAR